MKISLRPYFLYLFMNHEIPCLGAGVDINSRYPITRIVLPSRGSGGRNARTLTTTADMGLLNKQS